MDGARAGVGGESVGVLGLGGEDARSGMCGVREFGPWGPFDPC